MKKASPKKTKVGWIGTGVMGHSMCGHLLKAGYTTFVHNRNPDKAQALIQSGAVWKDTPAEVAANSDVIFTIVSMPADVRQVYLESDGVLETLQQGSVVVDMTTSSPSLAREISLMAFAKGAMALDAPVSGGDVGAREARLSIMVGGDEEAFKAVMPLFKLMGQTIVYHGQAGCGQHTKLCNQIIIAGTMIGVCESLLYGYRAELDLNTMLQSVAKGAAACWTLDNLVPRMLKRNFDPGFFVEHFIKDLGLALEEARRMGLALPGLALAEQLYLAVKAQGHGKDGIQALLKGLETINQMKI